MSRDPYALDNLLPAGTVLLQVQSDAAIATVLDAVGDDWSPLNTFLEVRRLHKLETASQLRLDHNGLYLHIRIYLIPFDLPGVFGRLAARNRDETKILTPARKALFSILKITDRCAGAWAGYPALEGIREPFISREHDDRSLSEIYGDLPSPVIDPFTFLSRTAPVSRAALLDALTWEAPPGMVPLYAYQRRTVARMLQQELDPGLAPDPLYIPIRGVRDSKTFYLQPSSMEILREPPMRSQAKGGILCEEMGTGKTCMILALIMATKKQLSTPDDAQPWGSLRRPLILTPLAFRYFPKFESARSAARLRRQEKSSSLPSLVEMLVHYIRASPEGIGPPDPETILQEKYPHLWEPLMRNHPFIHVYKQVPEVCSPRRKGQNPGPRKLYLTSATLVVVPGAIFEQWDSEINKHCHTGALRVCKIKTSQMPTATELASLFDVVLISHEVFAAEKSRCDASKLYSWVQCECKPEEGEKATRLPMCTCPVPDTISPLVQIHWKRLVVDEGHASATHNNLSLLAQELSVERRWIVSGTPTRNLMGLSLGQSGSSTQIDDPSHEDYVAPMDEDDQSLASGELIYPDDPTDEEYFSNRKNNDRKTTQGADSSHSEYISTGQNDPRHHLVRRWTDMDRQDLNKLGDMISRFLGVPQFAHETGLFRKAVIAPLLDRSGPSFGAIQVVSQVMSQVMIRHQIRDVEQELPEKLPTLKEKTVALKFHPLAAKTYNVHQSLIAVNAVDSMRRDQDYLFHPTQTKQLRNLLENLSQAMFWRTDEDLFDIDEAVERAEKSRDVALGRDMPASDLKLIEDSIRMLRSARDDHLWRAMMHDHENPFLVQGLPPALRTAWMKLDPSLLENDDSLISSHRICKLRDILVKSPLISEQRLIWHGVCLNEEEQKDAIDYENYIRSRKRKRRHDSDPVEHSKVWHSNVKAVSKEVQEELSHELFAAINRREGRDVTGPAPSMTQSLPNAPSPFELRPCISPRVRDSFSAKINYILRKVLKHASRKKFLIFSSSPLSLAYVAEALEAVQVPYLQYTSGVKARVRHQTVVTFETSERYRALLMELKLGARGLNLVTASRIIFCEPVWQGDVESQAIKRAHRIGQKAEEIKVTTLVMQGTSEEVMVTRRNALRHQSQLAPSMEQDVSMRHFIQNPTFIEVEPVEPAKTLELDIPLTPPRSGVSSSSQAEEPPPSLGEIVINLEMGAGSKLTERTVAPMRDDGPAPVKVRKMVHFG